MHELIDRLDKHASIIDTSPDYRNLPVSAEQVKVTHSAPACCRDVACYVSTLDDRAARTISWMVSEGVEAHAGQARTAENGRSSRGRGEVGGRHRARHHLAIDLISLERVDLCTFPPGGVLKK